MGEHQYSHLFSEETARRICLILDLTLQALKVMSINFLLIISLLYKTEWS